VGNWYRVVKTIKGHRYLYEQRTWREGKHVRTQSRFIGKAGDTGSDSSSGQTAQAGDVVNAAEFITKTLGLEIERLADTRRKGAKLIKYRSGRVTIGLSRDMRLDDPDTQSSLWHEVGHYIDDPRTMGGRSQMNAKFTFGKVSTPNRNIIRQHKEYILKERKPIRFNY
jgi:hypothetical protein